ncbi:hypothetical protein NEOLEDRAFT_536534 [Neolentinus lepideus HHB14362 ss-1]|uniref:Uncharacterized protein n=1 Tax=Neolentinus lepideus HHB14362 ss-1 TaxID=1314782 RepID=A0A165RAW6_9AGAM|nr:hypothetical protein NEOLEDRAFT_536534 [Neolentinus lepideus HHB14362 ss-1]
MVPRSMNSSHKLRSMCYLELLRLALTLDVLSISMVVLCLCTQGHLTQSFWSPISESTRITVVPLQHITNTSPRIRPLLTRQLIIFACLHTSASQQYFSR